MEQGKYRRVKYLYQSRVNKMNKTIDWTIEHQLNTSKTKSTHKFSKSSRFPKTFQSPCLQSAYDISQSAVFLNRQHRKHGKFGREPKFLQFDRQIRRHSLSPCPGAYTMRSAFHVQNKNQKSSTFGTDLKLKFKAKQVPGPGSYDSTAYNPQSQLSYTMRNRTKKNGTHWNKVGPGQYNPTLSFLSNTREKNTKIGKQVRFYVRDNQFPAPGTYNLDLERIMTQPTSKYRDPQKCTFGRDSKLKNSQTCTPGPGYYREFSEFYDAPLSGGK